MGQYILFEETEVKRFTTVLIPTTSEKATQLAIFTQHVPSEFMAHFLRDSETGEYVFPVDATLYVDKESNKAIVDNNDIGDSNKNIEEEPALDALAKFGNGLKIRPPYRNKIK